MTKGSVPDYRVYELYWPEYLRLCFFSLLACALLVLTFYRSLPLLFLLSPAALLYPFFQREKLGKKRRQQLLLQFREALSILGSFLAAGYSMENAFLAATPELASLLGENCMMHRELLLIGQGLALNKPLEELLLSLAERSGVDDIQNFSEIFIVAKRSGGELTRIIRQTTEIIRGKLSVMEEILTQNASRRYEQKLMNLVPFFIILYLSFSSPDFFSILYTTVTGRLVMSGCLIVYIAARILSEKILAIEV